MTTEDFDWDQFYTATRHRQPREIFTEGLAYVPDHLPREAIEVGFGAGNEVIKLLELQWQVMAIDAEEHAAEILRSRVADQSRLMIVVSRYEDVTFQECSFVHAGFSLPFCQPAVFPQVWSSLTKSIRSDGIFCGQLFGVEDAWKNNVKMNFHSKPQVEKLLENFDIIKLDETKGRQKSATGGEKYWHFFNIIAKKH